MANESKSGRLEELSRGNIMHVAQIGNDFRKHKLGVECMK